MNSFNSVKKLSYLLFFTIPLLFADDSEKVWDLDMLNNMDFTGGIADSINSTDPTFYNNLYVFGDHLSDSGNLLGTRFVPNQWPLPIGDGVYLYSEPLSLMFTHKIPLPWINNKSFPTAKIAEGPFNLTQRINSFVDHHARDFGGDELFVFWGGVNDVRTFVNNNRFNVFNYPQPDFSHDANLYIAAINSINQLNGDIIFMNVPDLVIFPGARLTANTNLSSLLLRNFSKFLHFDFNQNSSSAYLNKLHNETGIHGFDNIMQKDLAEFKAKYWFINPEIIDNYAQAYYAMQLDAVDTINKQLYDALEQTNAENIIYADVRGFMKEMMNDDKEFFGFDNVQSPECGPYSAANACKTNPSDQEYNYLFGDGYNLSYKGQKEVFSYLSMMTITPYILAGIYSAQLSSNIEMNTDIINGYSIKTGNLDEKPTINLLFNKQWQYFMFDVGYNVGLRMMNYRVPFVNQWATTSYFAPYINYKLTDSITLGLENQLSVNYYEIRREVTFEGRQANSGKDRYEKANLDSEKILLAGTAQYKFENDLVRVLLRGLLGPAYAINHRYEDRRYTSTSVSFAPNNLFYLHGEAKFSIDFKKFPTEKLNFGMEVEGQYNQAMNDLELRGNTKRAPVQFKRKIQLVTNYEGEWAAYLKYKLNKTGTVKFGYQGRNYNYIIRNGVFANLQYTFK